MLTECSQPLIHSNKKKTGNYSNAFDGWVGELLESKKKKITDMYSNMNRSQGIVLSGNIQSESSHIMWFYLCNIHEIADL